MFVSLSPSCSGVFQIVWWRRQSCEDPCRTSLRLLIMFASVLASWIFFSFFSMSVFACMSQSGYSRAKCLVPAGATGAPRPEGEEPKEGSTLCPGKGGGASTLRWWSPAGGQESSFPPLAYWIWVQGPQIQDEPRQALIFANRHWKLLNHRLELSVQQAEWCNIPNPTLGALFPDSWIIIPLKILLHHLCEVCCFLFLWSCSWLESKKKIPYGDNKGLSLKHLSTKCFCLTSQL